MQPTTDLDFTRQPDAEHPYALTFRLYAGNGKDLTRWFPTIKEAWRFASRNAITVLGLIREESK